MSAELLERAREMRLKMAPAERLLWFCLRDRRLGGFKFRRQVPIGPFVADFYCAECTLIVESDGASHFERQQYDADRTAWLTDHGHSVVRYENQDVYEFLDSVLSAILDECERRARLRTCPSPLPSPPSTGERE